MIYTVRIVGSFEAKKFDVATPSDAVVAFGREVALPQSGWVLVEGKDGTVKQYAVRDAVVDHHDIVDVQATNASTTTRGVRSADNSGRGQKVMKLILPVFILSGLALFAWPFVAFGTIFLFDAPIRSSLDGHIRYSAAGTIMLYPVVWVAALAVAVAVRNEPKWKPLFFAALLAPFLWIGLAGVLLAAWDHQAR